MRESKYDVIIIGSGLGGLACGNYLAKSGMKVAIFERNDKAGGCCSSFSRGAFTFDSGAHIVSGLGENGILRKVIKDLNMAGKLKFTRPKIYDKVIFPKFSFTLGSDIKQTISQVQNLFPKESKKIESFFNFIEKINFMKVYPYLKKRSFVELLYEYFSDRQLIKVFLSLAGYLGTEPRLLSSFGAIDFFREVIFDGGYYPYGSMQRISDAFADNFKQMGGDIFFSSPVNKIILKDSSAKGVILANKRRLYSSIVVSNADARQTFINLVGKSHLPCRFMSDLLRMLPTVSAFCVFLGLNKRLSSIGMKMNLSYMYDIKDDIRKAPENGYLIMFSSSLIDRSLSGPDKDTLNIMKLLPFRGREFWNKNKEAIAQKHIDRAEELLPGLSRSIIFRDIATPFTYYRHTQNYAGAIGGWALTPSQTGNFRLNQVTPVTNLYLAGHWTRPGLGLTASVRSGALAAERILRNLKKEAQI
ncbi:MAG: NAD(P)/FAD-dependent oxidoreductase [Candidatus Omnitrophota bacterium]